MKIYESPFSEYNQNSTKDPFLLMILDKFPTIQYTLKEYSKIIIRENIILILLVILNVICTKSYLYLITIPIFLFLSIFFLRIVSNSIPLTYINDFLNSDEFKFNGINDEKLFKLLNILWSSEGKLEVFNQFISSLFLLSVAFQFINAAFYFWNYLSIALFST